MMQGVISYPTFIRNLQDINAGKPVPWQMIARCILSMGISDEDPLCVYAQCLVNCDGDVGVALKEWRKIARQLEIQRPREHEKKFGILPKEAPDVWPPKKNPGGKKK